MRQVDHHIRLERFRDVSEFDHVIYYHMNFAILRLIGVILKNSLDFVRKSIKLFDQSKNVWLIF